MSSRSSGIGGSVSVYESDKPGYWHVGCERCGWHSYGQVWANKERLEAWADLHKKFCPAVNPVAK